METQEEFEAAGKDESKLLEMVATVNSMMQPVLMRVSLERHATAAMQALLQGDASMVCDKGMLARHAWDIAEAMTKECIRRGEVEMQAVMRDLERGAAGLSAQAGQAGGA